MANAPDENTLFLTVNGQQYYGWTAASISRSIEAVAGGYTLSTQDRWINQPIRWPIMPNDSCVVSIGNDVLISGYADKLSPGFSADAHNIGIEGRDKTADLVDCAAYAPPGSWAIVDFMTVVKAIASFYGVSIALAPGAASPGKLPGFVIQNGETAWAAIERACKRVGVLAYPDGSGGVLIGSPGSVRCDDALVEGKNIKVGSADYDYKERFSDYRILAQAQGTDDAWGPQAAEIVAEAKDAVFGSRKRMMIEVDMGLTAALAQSKANWNATVRAARSGRMKVTVQGYRQSTGKLWTFNQLVSLTSATLGIEKATDVLIAGVSYSKSDESGSETVLDCMRPDAFKPEPFIPEVEIWNEANNVKG